MSWTVMTEDDRGEVNPLRFSSATGVDVTVELVHRMVSEHYLAELPSAFRFLDDERRFKGQQSCKAGVESISQWGREISDLMVSASTTGHVRIDFDRDALVMTRRRNPTPADRAAFEERRRRFELGEPGFVDEFVAAVWNDRDLIIIPVGDANANRSIEITYVSDDTASPPAGPHRSLIHGHEIETLFEWRGYFGGNSGAIDGLTRMVKSGTRYIAQLAGAQTGFIVGTIIRRVATSKVAMSGDKLFEHILHTNTEHFPQFHQQVPELTTAFGTFTGASAIVLVHGTVSSCAAAFHDLPHRSGLFAFEHDTFLNIIDNAKELERNIRRVLGNVQRVLLIGHSRGGLVARCAAHRLAGIAGFYPTVAVWTFGTPHKGTPVAAAGGDALQLIAAASNPIGPQTGCVDTRLAAITRFLPMLAKSPPGIAQMVPDCDFLQLLTPPGENDNFVTAYAGNYDITDRENGFGIAFRGSYGRIAFDGKANDLVVPTASAAGCGPAPRFVQRCAHSSYFAQPSIQYDISTW